MTYYQKSKKRISELSKKREELKKCIDKHIDEAVYKILTERDEYQQRCHHKYKEKLTKFGGGHKWCPRCGIEFWWGTCVTPTPTPPPLPPYEEDVTNLLKKWEFL
jgi:hypothetical protein